jgi:2-polyprenyl-6-hydroxyphenyl methylase/3-demethylubiquinone-9 3-methyltransferase
MSQRPAPAISQSASVDPADVARFDRLGEEWWNLKGPMRGLHKLNPERLAYLRDLICAHFTGADGGVRNPRGARALAGLRILDIGCGGGLLSEPLARMGAVMTSIDPAPGNIAVAARHAGHTGLSIDYRAMTAEELAEGAPLFDVVLTMEVVEHVRDVPAFLMVAASMVRPGGLLVAATLNRTLRAYALAIVGAEYLLRWVEPGTHDWKQFVTPDELRAALVGGGLDPFDETGLVYNPLADSWSRSRDMAVNYMMAARRP